MEYLHLSSLVSIKDLRKTLAFSKMSIYKKKTIAKLCN